MVNFDIISILFQALAWLAIVLFAYQIYKRQVLQPRIWKIVVIMIVGLVSFTINLPVAGTTLNISILPLGVWVLFFLRGRRNSWQSYRSFAWLGFFANFIFLTATLLTIPIHGFIYPKDEGTTYLANIENASIIQINPLASEAILDKNKLDEQLQQMKQKEIHSDKWYEDMYRKVDGEQSERFPYQLIDGLPLWGSGLQSVVYVEEDGRGIVISTGKEQLYFRSDKSILKEEE